MENGDGWRFEASTDPTGCFTAGGVVATGRYKYRLVVEATGYEPARTKVSTGTMGTGGIVIVLASKGSGGQSRAEEVSELACDPEGARKRRGQ
jgi:hypothetical protein